MRILVTTLLVGAALSPATICEAKPYVHHRMAARHHMVHRYVSYARPPLEPSAPYYGNSYQHAPVPYVPYDDSASSIVLRRTIQSQGEPGLTSEIEPSAGQTATGGPSGGIPDHSGGGR